MPQTLSDRLREARSFSSLSARELDRLAGIGQGHSALIESGQRPNVEAKTATALARVLGVSLDWLLMGRGRPPSDAAIRAAVAEARKRSAA